MRSRQASGTAKPASARLSASMIWLSVDFLNARTLKKTGKEALVKTSGIAIVSSDLTKANKLFLMGVI